MKIFFNFMPFVLMFTLMLGSCTRKYSSYDVIGKLDFEPNDYKVPLTVHKLMPRGRDELSGCFNQWLFFSNAENEKKRAYSYMIKSLCPGENYLLQTEVQETWWTLILFSRACVKIKTMCGVTK